MYSSVLDIEDLFPSKREIAHEGSMYHVLEVLASHSHPFMLVGCSAQRWMGSAGMLTNGFDMLVRNNALESIALDLDKTGHWEFHDPGPHTPWESFPPTKRDADLLLRRTDVEQNSEYQFLSLWSETAYRITVDECPTVEVPDVYPWQYILVKEKWHPAVDRENGWWFGPRLHPDTAIKNLPERATPSTIFLIGLPRGKGPSSNHPILVPSLPTYLDALIYHKTQYQH
jgi:hypothetical protein